MVTPHKTMRYLALLLFLTLMACGESDPYAEVKQRLIGQCVLGGETVEACECQIGFAENELGGRDFGLMLGFVEAQFQNLSARETTSRLNMSGQELIKLSRRIAALDRPAQRNCKSRHR